MEKDYLSMTKFPLRAVRKIGPGGNYSMIVDADGKQLCIVESVIELHDRTDELERDAALAELFAAAPDLYAACEKVLLYWTFDNYQQHTHTWHDMQECAVALRAALAKSQPKQGA